jgi:predicted transcriptional regulator
MSKRKTTRQGEKRNTVMLTVSVLPELRADVDEIARDGGETISALVSRALLSSNVIAAGRMRRIYRGIVDGTAPDVESAIAKMRAALASTREAWKAAEELDQELARFQDLTRTAARQNVARTGIRELVK